MTNPEIYFSYGVVNGHTVIVMGKDPVMVPHVYVFNVRMLLDLPVKDILKGLSYNYVLNTRIGHSRRLWELSTDSEGRIVNVDSEFIEM